MCPCQLIDPFVSQCVALSLWKLYMFRIVQSNLSPLDTPITVMSLALQRGSLSRNLTTITVYNRFDDDDMHNYAGATIPLAGRCAELCHSAPLQKGASDFFQNT
ncbi:hypothetical protein OUZ56_023365 [Daphnia magna]|uniref:Uncharacterized protein n=1 Tax=Daphnia magna TaxID=35525 RepID=A0ABR0AZ14_9CRUS|nr:hypothetical protein OUZ56_023365 [Daphnia magna]